MTVSFRTEVRAGILGTLNTYIAANPTMLRKAWATHPASLQVGELPVAWIDHIDTQSVLLANGERQQNLIAVVRLADIVTENQEAIARQDALVDALMDAFTADYHSANGYSITEPIGYASVLENEGGVPYLAVDYSLRAYIAQGRI